MVCSTLIKLVNIPGLCLDLFRNVMGMGRSLAHLRSPGHQPMACSINRNGNSHTFPSDVDLTCYGPGSVVGRVLAEAHASNANNSRSHWAQTLPQIPLRSTLLSSYFFHNENTKTEKQ